MQIKTSDLNKIKEGGFLKSKIAEKSIALLISNSFGYAVKAGDSEGYDPTGDVYINNHLIEVKYSAAGNGSNGYHFFVETHDRFGNPSGLLTSTSKLYLTVTPGWSSKIGPIGKVRLWHLHDLLVIMKYAQVFTYPSGGKGFFIQPKLFDNEQIWVGDITYDKDQQIFDTEKFIQLGNIYKVKEALK